MNINSLVCMNTNNLICANISKLIFLYAITDEVKTIVYHLIYTKEVMMECNNKIEIN